MNKLSTPQDREKLATTIERLARDIRAGADLEEKTTAILTALTHPREEIGEEDVRQAKGLAETLQWHMHEGPGIMRTEESDLVDRLVALLTAASPSSPPEDANALEHAERLRRASADCSGHEPSLSVLQRAADDAADYLSSPPIADETPEWRKPYRTQDGSGDPETAGAVGWAWISNVARQFAQSDLFHINTYPANADGSIVTLYDGTKLLAAYSIFRDEMNFAVLIRWVDPSLETDCGLAALSSTPAPIDGEDSTPPECDARTCQDPQCPYTH